MIYIGADHRGYALKEKLKNFLTELGQIFEDVGAHEIIPEDDYPDYAQALTSKIQPGDCGVLICGSGAGVSIAANRKKGIRCALAIDADQIQSARRDDDINVLAFAADEVTEDHAKEILKMFLETEFAGEERHKRRIQKIDNY